ncbi:hypothetical protein B7Z28_01975 [Candidatus Saccharibacteria bacterium 32-45-3]|nr:MAG: hypothetical protein B7Z28_01975 [Candidatus Saccharibacteria bacterium 32-45-3]
MLHNTFYIGTIHFNGQDYPGAHEPLLKTELFQAVKLKLSGGSQAKRTLHSPLFKGMVRCETCRGVVTWQCQKGRYYGACQRRRDCCKGTRLLRQDRLEEDLLIQLEVIDHNGAGRARLHTLDDSLRDHRQPYVGQHRLSVIKMIKQRVRRLERMEDCLYDDKLAGLISEQRYKQKADKMHDELDYLRMRLDRLEKVESRVQVSVDRPTSLCALYTSESKAGKRIIMQKLFVITLRSGQARFVSLKD